MVASLNIGNTGIGAAQRERVVGVGNGVTRHGERDAVSRDVRGQVHRTEGLRAEDGVVRCGVVPSRGRAAPVGAGEVPLHIPRAVVPGEDLGAGGVEAQPHKRAKREGGNDSSHQGICFFCFHIHR